MKKYYFYATTIAILGIICLLVNGCTQPKNNEDILTTSKIETFYIAIPVQDTRIDFTPNLDRHKPNLDLLISVNTETEEINDIEISDESFEFYNITEEEFNILWQRELEYLDEDIEATPTDEYSEIRVEFYNKWQECKAIEEKRERISCKVRELSAYLSACLMGYLGW